MKAVVAESGRDTSPGTDSSDTRSAACLLPRQGRLLVFDEAGKPLGDPDAEPGAAARIASRL
jgi:hypothetical protein